ncbi:E4 SUMO-protein ligase PIAL2 [Linum grandiflorum]
MNGKGVVKRTNVDKDSGPQIPTSVTGMLKYGTNLLQAIGTFNGNYVILVAFVSTMTLPYPPVLIDYVQSDRTSLDPDCDIIEGPSRISLNCPISFSRIKFPVKGSLCKHLQCFDFGNYVEINSKRPSWRCPHCNQNVSYDDIRVDQNIVQVLKEVGDSITHVNISADGSWKAIADADQNQGVTPVRHSLGELHGQQDNADSPATPMILDLTEGGDDLMDELLSNLDTVERKPSRASSPGQTANQKNAVSAGSGFRSGVQYRNAVSQSSSMVNRGNIDARSQFAPVVSDYASMQLQQLRTPVHRVPRAVQALPARNQVPILPRTNTSNVNSVSSNPAPSTSNGFSTGPLQRFSKPHHDFPRNFNHQSRSSPYRLASRPNPVPTTGPQRASSPVPLRMPSPASHPTARSSSPLSRTSSFQGTQTGVSSSVPHSQGMGRATYTSNPDISRTTAAQPATATTTTVNSDQNRRPASRMRGSLQGRDLAEIRNLVLQSTQQTPGGTSSSTLTGATAPPHLRGLFGQK